MSNKCKQCGACCRYWIIEADWLDAIREPRLLGADCTHAVSWPKCIVLAAGQNFPCRFLGSDNRCTIYPTRPNVCVGFEPGGEQCLEARRALGIKE